LPIARPPDDARKNRKSEALPRIRVRCVNL
jgi:hypothetical protein